MITIRHAQYEEINNILEIYNIAKQYMIKNGNKSQWIGNYPSKELLENDINKKQLYVLESNNNLIGVFAFIFGENPTYINIEGDWLNNEPYGTIHRIASNGLVRNIFNITIDYCTTITNNIRIDTHKDNKKMQQLIKNKNFSYCGIIYVADGSPRLAYQLKQKSINRK